MSIGLLLVACGLWVSEGPTGPLDLAAQRIATLPADPPGTNNDTHYLVSNERRLDLFFDRLPVTRGGVLIGVGAEQLLILAGWTRPDLVVALDFDPVIVDLHRVHAALLCHAEDPRAFVALWADEGRAAEVLAADGALARVTAVHRLAARVVSTRLVELHERPWRGKTPRAGPKTFLTDLGQYDIVRSLAKSGRLVAIQGDLTGDVTLPALAAALRDHDLLVRTLYLSNAEQYFMYGDGYRRNLLALPMDDRTVILRTLPGRPRDFEYLSQRGPHFQGWLQRPRVRSVYAIRGLAKGAHLVGETAHRLGPPPK